MCQPINKLDYKHYCYETLVTLGKKENVQYLHYFSLVCTKGISKNLIILSDGPIFSNEYIFLYGFYPDEPKRLTKWFITYSSSLNKNIQNPLCYGDRVYLYDSDRCENIWAFPNKLITKNISKEEVCEWQISWNDGTLPPKVNPENFIVKEEKSLKNKQETTITVYKKDLSWMIAGSILIALVVIMLVVLIILSYYISRVWKIKLKDFIINKK